jgi:hypothetical protein
MDPIESAEPTEPIDRKDPVEPIDKNESSDHSESVFTAASYTDRHGVWQASTPTIAAVISRSNLRASR